MIVLQTLQVTQFLRWLEVERLEHFQELRTLFEFLEEHRHGATYPEVVSPILQSRHYPLMGEVRVSQPFPPYRVLFTMDLAEMRLVYLVAGNKAEGQYRGNDWYDAWVPVADAFIDNLPLKE